MDHGQGKMKDGQKVIIGLIRLMSWSVQTLVILHLNLPYREGVFEKERG
jgi:hypothetical protein